MASATDPDAMMDGGMKRELDLLFDSLMQADAQTSEASEASESKKEEESEKEDPSDTDAITSASFQYALEALGLNPSPDEVAAILAEVGVEPGQSITRAHFHDMVERNSEHDVGLHVVAGLDGGTTPTTTAAAADTSQDSTEGLKRLQSKGSVALLPLEIANPGTEAGVRSLTRRRETGAQGQLRKEMPKREDQRANSRRVGEGSRRNDRRMCAPRT